MGPIRKKIEKIEGRFFYLLVTLVALIGLYPYFDLIGSETFILSIFYVAIPVAGIYAAGYTKRLRLIALILGVPAIVAGLSSPGADRVLPTPVAALLGSVFYIFAIGAILGFIAKEKRVTVNTIYGALSVYLLLGITWSGLYATLEEIRPGSFSVQDIHNIDGVLNYGDFFYYSFVTLTTLGYGEITPVTDQTRSLAILEALTGVLFTGVLIARLVGMYSSSPQDDEGHGESPDST